MIESMIESIAGPVLESIDGVALTHGQAVLGDVSLHYVEAGEGPLVVLLHGFPEFWYSWRSQIPALVRAGYRVIAPDLRGYNLSSKPEGIDAYRLTTVVQDIAGLIVKTTEPPCVLAGHDWGGVIAWFLPMLHPGLVRKLVVLNSPHPVPLSRELRHSKGQKLRLAYQVLMQPPHLPELFMSLFGFAALRMMLRRAGNFSAPEIAHYVEAWRQPGALAGMTNYYRALRRHRAALRPLVRPLDIPTLMIWGERDPVFTRGTTENFSEYVPDLRIERVVDAGHFVQTDAPDRVNKALVEFLKS
jgi:pimeloyl-ACP methyl ester carboxylesterase